jgi:hypothetical protein
MIYGCVGKIAKTFTISVCPSVHMEKTRFPLDGFSWNLIFEYFSKICRENSSVIKVWHEWRVLYMETNIPCLPYLAQFFLEWEVFQTKILEKLKTHISYTITIFRRHADYEMWKNILELERWQLGACALHNGFLRLKRMLVMCNTYWFSSVTMVTRTQLNFTLYAHCLSCSDLSFYEYCWNIGWSI